MEKWLCQMVEKHWDESGECASCGWHAALYKYDLPFDAEWNAGKSRIELPCLSGDDENSLNHRGVRIYPTEKPPKP